MKRAYLWMFLAGLQALWQFSLYAADPPALVLTNLSVGAGQLRLNFAPYPSAAAYTFLSGTNLHFPLRRDTNFYWVPSDATTSYATNGRSITTNLAVHYEWRNSNAPPPYFARLLVTPLRAEALLTAIALNRLAYGPTPDELERVLTGPSPIGAQAFINEQLAPETITETVDNQPAMIKIAQKLVEATTPMYTNASALYASISDLRAWHVMRAVGARRQLLEILLQFLENHFVTQYSKSVDYFATFAADGATATRAAAQFEYLENERWRNALLNPASTFYDLLKISAESPAMIIYLDTALNAGNNGQPANENYARELMELFTMGVNNGYDQNDVTALAPCWTGWSVRKVAVSNAFNPFAPVLGGSVDTNVGVWALNFRAGDHSTNSKTIFQGKSVPARFGPPWAGRNYQLNIPARTGNSGMQDGYDVLTNLANLPFTQEFISVKLCRLLVHDNFGIGYDFTDPSLSAEGQLVRQCMLTWENSNPKGQFRAVLGTIFGSALFRGNAAAAQKVKTPLEYTISAIRALRSSTNGTGNPGTFTAETDGYSISGTLNGNEQDVSYPLMQIGGMALFDRQDPNGYPEDGPAWISSGTLAERIRWIQAYCMSTSDSSKNDFTVNVNNSVSDPVALLKYKLPLQNPPGSITNEANVADYLLSILYPGEGQGNLTLYRAAAMQFLSRADDGVTVSPLAELSTAGNPSPFENRIRGAVAMLLSFQRFQEQ
jgi:uncharacterized protein (DUF1800 family)